MKLEAARVMAFPRKLVESVVLGLANPLNRHLVKLAGFDFPPELRRHFRREVRTWLSDLQALRFKPNDRTGSFKFYFDFLYDYPFGGIEVRNMRSIMELTTDQYEIPPLKTPEEMVEWLRQCHTELAERLHKGEDVLDMIPE
ncbi:MAG: hypothetical protein JO305_08920 [Alphaproteobacteria bacterium]|nr:hypothetical protein [Alphaproteobacteria bacterium]